MTGDPLKVAGGVVEALGSALRSGEHGLTTAPRLLLRILREESWREFVTQRGEVVQWDRFADFVATPPLKGLGASVRLVEKIVAAIEDEKARTEAQSLLEQARQNPNGGSRKISLTVDIVNGETDLGRRPTGNSKSRALRKLRTDAPELHAEVLAGRLSAHGAMVKAGYRPRTATVRVDSPEKVAEAIRRFLSPEDIARVISLLLGTG